MINTDVDHQINMLFHVYETRNGSNARGYFTWSFMDTLELLDGYESSYGLYYIDLDDPEIKRQPKLSAHWYSKFLKNENFTAHLDSDQHYFSQ